MKPLHVILVFFAMVFVLGSVLLMTPKADQPATPISQNQVSGDLESKSLPSASVSSSKPFVPNRGQWDHQAKYVARFGSTTAFIEKDGWVFTIEKEMNANENQKSNKSVLNRKKGPRRSGVAIGMRFVNANPQSVLTPFDRMQGYHNYFLGNNPRTWKTNVPIYRGIRITEIYDGIGVALKESQGALEYDLELGSQEKPETIIVECNGVNGLRINSEGALVMETDLGDIVQPQPKSWIINLQGIKQSIDCRYVLLGHNRFSFTTEKVHNYIAMVIDPLIWATYLGGGGMEGAKGFVQCANDDLVICSFTASTNYPSTLGVYQPAYRGGKYDGVVSRISGDGKRLVWSTFIGGSKMDYLDSIKKLITGNFVVAGYSDSTNYPTTTSSYQTSYAGGLSDIVISCLSSNGQNLVSSTFLGGTGHEGNPTTSQIDLNVGASGQLYLCAHTGSKNFPVTKGAYDTSFNGGSSDGVVCSLDSSLKNLLWSTYIGGSNNEDLFNCIFSKSGNIVVCGSSSSINFPTTNSPFPMGYSGQGDGILFELSKDGKTLLMAGFLGGSDRDTIGRMDIDKQGNYILSGTTRSKDFLTTAGVIKPKYSGSRQEAFVSSVDPTGKLNWSTYLGGTSWDYGIDCLCLESNNIVISGYTYSANFPVTPNGFQTTKAGREDCFLCMINNSGSKIIWSTFFGGNRIDHNIRIQEKLPNQIIGTGSTSSTNFPVSQNCYDQTYNGSNNVWYADTFVFQCDIPVLKGIAQYGKSTPSCLGPIGLTALSPPFGGNVWFGFGVNAAPPGAPGFIGLSFKQWNPGINLFGISLFIDFKPSNLVLLPIQADIQGNSILPAPLPTGTTGAMFYVQTIWLNTPSCGGWGSLSASDALQVKVY